MDTITASRTMGVSPARSLRGRLHAASVAALLLVLVSASTGMGAGQISSTVPVATTVYDTISLTAPDALDSKSADDVSWFKGPPGLLSLGSLQASEIGAASATWKVSTTAANGYTLALESSRDSTPILRSTGSTNTFPDMCVIGSGSCPSSLVTNASGFGVAIGNGAARQDAVPASWGSGTAQGTLYAGVPTDPVVIATRSSSASNDPVTITFKAVSAPIDQPPSDVYVGTMRLTATTL